MFFAARKFSVSSVFGAGRSAFILPGSPSCGFASGKNLRERGGQIRWLASQSTWRNLNAAGVMRDLARLQPKRRWEDVPPPKRRLWETLGWSQSSWDLDGEDHTLPQRAPPSMDLRFHQLSPVEKSAANALGYKWKAQWENDTKED